MIEVRHSTAPEAIETATSTQLRADYLVDNLFVRGEVRGVYTHEDRMVLAGAIPGASSLTIPSWPAIGTETHLARRELGVINLGDTGTVTVDGIGHTLNTLDGLYAGRGSDVVFSGDEACFYLVSALADVTHPIATFSRRTVEPLVLGDSKKAAARQLYRYVWSGGHPSCQLQIGVTVVEDGSVWNTMPPHLHDRRTEVYLYTGLEPTDRVVHFMGKPGATRHVLVSDRQAVISPAWSIHAGVGTGAYAFVWAMAGENTEYTDLLPVPLETL